MNLINLDCQGFGKLQVVGEKLNDGHDFFVRSNCKSEALDVLVFLDSRGISARFEGSIADQVEKALAKKTNYLLICRPLELTTWATLYNFLKLNNLRPKKIITNMGFVDFTPKKKSILEDAIFQAEYYIGKDAATAIVAENYISSHGEEIALYEMVYSNAYLKSIQSIAQASSVILIDTPIVKSDIRVERQRPASFFSNLKETNKFNSKIGTYKTIDLPVFDETKTYDGVHYTALGNEIILNELKPFL
jgi:hypothetical protein